MSGEWCCPKCAWIFTDVDAAKDGIVTCPHCHNAWSLEKRCGTCAMGQELPGQPDHVLCVVNGISVGFGFFRKDGPSWPDCRDWKPKE